MQARPQFAALAVLLAVATLSHAATATRPDAASAADKSVIRAQQINPQPLPPRDPPPDSRKA